jgi:hypothetical protein
LKAGKKVGEPLLGESFAKKLTKSFGFNCEIRERNAGSARNPKQSFVEIEAVGAHLGLKLSQELGGFAKSLDLQTVVFGKIF